MSPHDPASLSDGDAPDDRFATRLEALHDAIALGAAPRQATRDPSSEPEAGRLHKAQNCLRLIERVRRQNDSTPTGGGAPESDTLFPSLGGGSGGGDVADTPHRIGRFHIVRRLGEGGNGVVFLANDPQLHRQVALKVPRPEALLSDDWRRRFLREAEAAAALDHPHIVRVLEAQRVGAVCYIASAYCEGIALSDWLAQRHSTPVPPRPAAQLVLTLAEAVQHAHGRGVLHRDIKPSNVLLEQPAGETATPIAAERLSTTARLTDFGLARFLNDDSDATRSGTIVGTPAYMAPEQAEGLTRQIDVRTDVYALGMLLYELLTQEAPFRRETALAALQAVRLQEPPRVNRAGVLVPPDLEAICLKCLEKEQAKRYPTAEALANDLRNFLENRPVLARRTGMIGRLARWSRRRPAIAALTGAVAALGIVLTVGASFAAVWLNDSHRDALDHLEKAILEKDKANRSERLAMQTLFEARLSQARATRQSGLPGRRIDTLDSLKHATALVEPLGLGEKERLRLRNEALAAWSLADMRWNQGDIAAPRGEGLGWDREVEHHLVHDPAAAAILVKHFATGKTIAKLPLPAGLLPDLRTVMFSPDGQHIAVKLDTPGPLDAVQVWKRDGTTARAATEVSPGAALPLDFSPDGKWLALACPDSRVRFLEMPRLTLAKEWTDWFHPVTLRFDPSSTRLAVHRGDHVEIRDVSSGDVQKHLPCPAFVFRLAWSPDGRFLAAACSDRKIPIWRTDTGALQTTLVGHAGSVVNVDFHPDGHWLVSAGWDGVTRLWDYQRGEQLIRAGGACGRFSRDGRWLGGDSGCWEIFAEMLAVSVHQPRAPHSSGSGSSQLDFHPDGRLLVASNETQWSLWDAAAGRLLTTQRGGWARFDAAGKHLLSTTGYDDLVRLPIGRREAKQEIVYEIGAPHHLGKFKPGLSALDAKSGKLLVVPYSSSAPVVLADATTGIAASKLPSHRRARWIDVTADGRLAATGTWHGRDVLIHDLDRKKVLHKFPAGSARVKFSPDGRLLAVGQATDYAFWRTDTGKLAHRLPRSAAASVPGAAAFSPAGDMVCVCDDNHSLRLLDVKTVTEIARLPLPENEVVSALAFSPDGVRLIVGTETGGALHFFDLRRIRDRLAELALDWLGAPLPRLTGSAPGAIRISISLESR